ncbi:MAG: DUF4352 domain-containing protein [Dehalococcoidia bacterium]
MKYVWLLAAMTLIVLLATGCGGGGSKSSTPAQQTFDAEIDEARLTPVSDSVREYAGQLCSPLRRLLENAGDTFASFETPTTDDVDFSVLFEALAELKGPLSDFQDDMRDVDPPSELEDYHDAFIAELEYGIDSIDALSEGGLVGALTLPSPPPEAVTPPDLDAAVGQECGPELRDLVDEFGGDFFNSSDSGGADPTPATGGVGEDVESANYTLLLHGVQDPYAASDEFYAPAAGNRWVVVEVSLTNNSSEQQQYFVFDFKLKDTDNFEYDAGYADAPQELNSGTLAAGDTLRGRVAFEVPETAEITRLIYNPGFFGEDQIEIDLR